MKTKTNLIIYLAFTFCAFHFTSCNGKGDNRELIASGTIEAIHVRIASKVTGEVVQVLFEEGTPVSAGDTLLILDEEITGIQLRQAAANMRLAEAQLELLNEGARQEDIRQAEEKVTQTETTHNQSRIDLHRTRNLFEGGSVSQKQLDDAEVRFRVAESQYHEALEVLGKMRQYSRPAEIRAQQARLDHARATVDLFQKNMKDSYITAPVSGTVTGKPVEAGELAGQGTVVAVISRLDRVHLRIYLSASELTNVGLGQQVGVAIDADPDKRYPGTIAYISPVAEFTPRNIQTRDERVKLVYGVKIEIENPEGILKPGMPADAYITAVGEER